MAQRKTGAQVGTLFSLDLRNSQGKTA